LPCSTGKSARIIGLGERSAAEEKTDAYLADIANKQAKTESGHALYTMLLEPIPELSSKSHLVLIRDGRLNLLPWDALVDNSNRYLVETKNISYAPSVSSAIPLRNKPPIKAAKVLLAVGGIPYDQSGVLLASTRGSYSPEKLGNLPGSRDEVLDAARLLQARHAEIDLQLGEDGTKDALEQAIREKHSIVHLAVHALADSKNPDHAALFLLADKKIGTDGMLDSAESAYVASACEHRRAFRVRNRSGQTGGAGGNRDLVASFFASRCAEVVSTLWTIDDSFSRFLMAQFYTGIANGQTASVALRNAKLIATKHVNVKPSSYAEWASTFDRLAPELLAASPMGFQQTIHSSLAALQTSHTAFFKPDADTIPLRHALCTTTKRHLTADGERWVFQDVIEDGPADLAGIKPGQLLLATDGVPIFAADCPLFRLRWNILSYSWKSEWHRDENYLGDRAQ
jgi:CHAT domain-containing protein